MPKNKKNKNKKLLTVRHTHTHTVYKYLLSFRVVGGANEANLKAKAKANFQRKRKEFVSFMWILLHNFRI